MSVKSVDALGPDHSQAPNKKTSLHSLPDAMEEGVKLKMPVGLLGHATRSQKMLEGLRKTGGVEGVVREALRKFEDDLQRLKDACNQVSPADHSQRAAKAAWLERNVRTKEKYLEAMRDVFREDTPRLQLNDEEVETPDDQQSLRSALSSQRSKGSSKGSATSRRALASAAAKTKGLELEIEHRRRRRQLEEQERQLRLQREDEDLQLKLKQARLVEEALEQEEEINGAESLVNVAEQGPLPELTAPPPSFLPPVSTWAPRQPVEMPGPRVTTTWTHEPLPTLNARQQPNVPLLPDMPEGLLQHVLLPTSTLPTFKGDHLDFLWFMKAFEMRVESVTSDPTRRLHLLLQHLEGDAKTLVLGCQLASDPKVGYERAKHKLNTKYGNRIRQALAFKAKLLDWPTIRKDGIKDLERFSVQLQLCEEVKLTGGLGELDSAGTILQLMKKLPTKLQDAWQMKAYKIECHQHREAKFEDFTKFVCDTAAAKTHPVYGGKTEVKPEMVPPKRPSSAKVLATTAAPAVEDSQSEEISTATHTKASTMLSQDRRKTSCLFCKGNHPTDECRKASRMTIRERRNQLKGACFACLKAGHNAKDCPKRAICKKCQGDHPTTMHFDREQRDSWKQHGSENQKPKEEEKELETVTEKEATSCAVAHSTRVAVAVVPIKVLLNEKHYIVNAILDPGSTATFITERLVKRLGLQTDKGTLHLTTMTATKEPIDTKVVAGLRVTGIDQNEVVTLPPMYTVHEMPYHKDDIAQQQDAQQWEHLERIPFNWHPEEEIGLLIGMNSPDSLRPIKVVGGRKTEPYAVQTILGWSLNGPLKQKGERQTSVVANLIRAQQITTLLEHLHHVDFKDAYDFDSKSPSLDDLAWTSKVEHSIKRLGEPGHEQYQINLPFKDTRPALKNNRSQAVQRLQALAKKFQLNPTFKKDYTDFMSNMEKQGYVEEVINECGEEAAVVKPVFYVPHHGVYHPKKPGKLRVVFNCSSKFGGTSLNDCLLSGPDLTNSLLGVLIRFRQEAVAFTSDIESMFYRVQVPPDDRDSLRYLWWPGGVIGEKNIKTFRMKVHLFGATSSPSCANYALQRAATDAWKDNQIPTQVRDAVHRNFYVDDCLKSMPNLKAAAEMAAGLVKACQYGGFRLTKFTSNSAELMERIPKTEHSKKEVVNLDDKSIPTDQTHERALGVLWDVKKDAFMISANPSQQPIRTKRGLLSMLSAVYDPMGIAAPVVIVARILFRNLTKEQTVGWDDDLQNHAESEQWQSWMATLEELQTINVPRCFRPQNEYAKEGWQLHIFCDASRDAYAAVAYLRQEAEEDRDAHVAFVVGKARISPPKTVTIPRLELTAAKLATDIANVIGKELQYEVQERHFWSDSQTVLKYLSNTVRRFHTFVANRVQAILSSSKIEEWHYVPTHLNPADEGSRGSSPNQLKKGTWLTGPSFLKGRKGEWPTDSKDQTPLDKQDPEIHTLSTLTHDHVKPPLIEKMAQRYSSFSRLTRAVCTWRTFIRHVGGVQRAIRPIWTANSIKNAENSTIKALQAATWPHEISQLQANRPLARGSTLLNLSPDLDEEGILCIGSRVRKALPIIPGHSRIAKLIVEDAHRAQSHFGRQATASWVLRNFWITGLNKLVRHTIKSCPSCQRRKSMPQYQKMAELPLFRLQSGSSKAFETTGVDFFGPFLIKRARTTTKAYGVIFTCSTTRAVHLEVAEDLSSSAFQNALRRFIARRGHVQRLVSDNATNFVGAHSAMSQDLIRELQQMKRRAEPTVHWLSKRKIDWVFNPPGASHHGGFWERMIRSIRQALGAILPQDQQRPLTYDGLVTVLCEVEATLNNRPLTPVSEDLNDYEALTPNHLLLSMEGPTAPPGDFRRAAVPLKKQWRQVQYLANHFWKRWLQEYRSLLHRRHKWQQDQGRQLALNDVVLVMDNVRPREYWPLGRVAAVHPGKDGRVRVISVQTAKGLLKRSTNKVCLLEAASESCKSDGESVK